MVDIPEANLEVARKPAKFIFIVREISVLQAHRGDHRPVKQKSRFFTEPNDLAHSEKWANICTASIFISLGVKGQKEFKSDNLWQCTMICINTLFITMIISLESEWICDSGLPISAETQRCATALCFSFGGILSSSLHEGLGPLCTQQLWSGHIKMETEPRHFYGILTLCRISE